jgi:hypothetical protein
MGLEPDILRVAALVCTVIDVQTEVAEMRIGAAVRSQEVEEVLAAERALGSDLGEDKVVQDTVVVEEVEDSSPVVGVHIEVVEEDTVVVEVRTAEVLGNVQVALAVVLDTEHQVAQALDTEQAVQEAVLDAGLVVHSVAVVEPGRDSGLDMKETEQ